MCAYLFVFVLICYLLVFPRQLIIVLLRCLLGLLAYILSEKLIKDPFLLDVGSELRFSVIRKKLRESNQPILDPCLKRVRIFFYHLFNFDNI